MKNKIVEKDEFNVVGLEVSTDVEECSGPDNPAPKLWKDFMKRLPEIKNRKGDKFYGVSCVTGECSFKYIVGVEVENLDDVPANMVEAIVPKSKYVVFTHKGKLEKLKETYARLYEKDMPKSGLKQKEIWLEVYDDRFKEDSDDSEIDLYIAVE